MGYEINGAPSPTDRSSSLVAHPFYPSVHPTEYDEGTVPIPSGSFKQLRHNGRVYHQSFNEKRT